MNYKLQKVLKDNKISMIIIAALWLILVIVFIAPLAYAIAQANSTGNGTTFIEEFFASVSDFSAITKVFDTAVIGTFGRTLIIFTIVYFLFTIIGLYKSKPKHRYTDIEHGSSDWSEHGEQYRILSRNKGLILAQDNYLPIDKRGNVNVLVVGRFGFW